MNLENMLSERSQSQDILLFHLYERLKIGKYIGKVDSCLGLGGQGI